MYRQLDAGRANKCGYVSVMCMPGLTGIELIGEKVAVLGRVFCRSDVEVCRIIAC